jgi:hypothetical protein
VNTATLPRVLDVALAPARGEVLALFTNGAIVVLDDVSGAVVNVIALTPGASPASRIGLSPDQTRVIVFRPSNFPPFGPATAASLEVIGLAPGVGGGVIPIANGFPVDWSLHPERDTAFLIQSAGSMFTQTQPDVMIPVDYGFFAESPAIDLSPGGFAQIQDLVYVQGTLFTLLGQTSDSLINGVDPLTHLPLLTTPSGFGAGALGTAIGFGPGTAGPAFFVLTPSSNSLHELTASNLVLLNTVPVPPGSAYLELSSLGTEWLLATNPPSAPGAVFSIDPATLGQTFIGSLPSGESVRQILPQRSDSVGRAFVLSGAGRVTPLPTDPSSSLAPSFVLPGATSVGFLELVGE